MLINFCQEHLQTSVRCDTINTEGYEIANLLRDNEEGFLAYACMKPPIDIDFTFACWIKISHIIIWPTIGGQKSSGFRLSTKSRVSAEYNQIGTGFLNGNHENGIIFCWRNSEQTLVKPDSNFFSVISVRTRTPIDRVKSLRLSIIKTQNSVPGIKKIEIWGELSSFNNDQVSQRISQLLTSRIEEKAQQKLSETKTVEEIGTGDEDITRFSSSRLVIPEEFFDPITCSIMQQPVILPSGKIIDQSTLDNYEKNEALWGRKLSDPFTGIPFSEFNKQIFAASLKLQIDKFLSDNRDDEEVRRMPRTLGYSDASRTNGHESILRRKSSLKTDSILLLNKRRCSDIPIELNPAKHSRIESVQNSSSVKNIQDPSSSELPLTEQLLAKENDVSVDGNLENSLKIVLSRLKRFGDEKIPSEESSSIYGKNPSNCTCCEFPTFYKFPCDHVVCRKILLSNINFECPDCGLTYNSGQLQKVNV